MRENLVDVLRFEVRYLFCITLRTAKSLRKVPHIGRDDYALVSTVQVRAKTERHEFGYCIDEIAGRRGDGVIGKGMELTAINRGSSPTKSRWWWGSLF